MTKIRSYAISRTLYGTIAILAFLVGVEGRGYTLGEFVLGVLLTGLSLTLAHTYMYVAEHEWKQGRLATLSDVRRLAGKCLWVALPALVPVAAAGLVFVKLLAPAVGYDLSVWALVCWLFLSGFLSRWEAGFGLTQSMFGSALMGGTGVAFVYLKILLKT